MLLIASSKVQDPNADNQYEEISPKETEKTVLLRENPTAQLTLDEQLREAFSSWNTRDVYTQTRNPEETEFLTEQKTRHPIPFKNLPWYRKKAEELDTLVKKNSYRAALIMLAVGIAVGIAVGAAIVYFYFSNSSFSGCTTPEFLGMTTPLTPYNSTTPTTPMTTTTTTKIYEDIETDDPEESISELMRFFKKTHDEHILSRLVRGFFLEFCPKLIPLHKDSVMTPEEQNIRYLCDNAFKSQVTEFGCLPEFGTFKNFSIDVLDPFKADEAYIEHYCKDLSKKSLIENMEKMKNAAYKCYPDFGKDMPYTDDTNELSLLCVGMLTRFLDIFRNHKDVIWNHLD
jgi:uncharacterized membrane protein YwzB